MALRVCFALGSVVGPWLWLGCSVFVCVCVYVCVRLGLGGVLSKRFESTPPKPKMFKDMGFWVQFGLGGVLSKRFESAPGSKIQDPRCSGNFSEHLGSWILDPGALQSALKAHLPNRICSTNPPPQGPTFERTTVAIAIPSGEASDWKTRLVQQ